jgi:hypothetical protein
MLGFRRLTAESSLGGLAEGPRPYGRIARRRVERSLGRSLAVLEARRGAGYPSSDYQVVVEVSGGGPSYQEFKRSWDRKLRRAGGEPALDTRNWPATLPEDSRANIVLPLSRASSGRYRLGLEPIWTVTHKPSLDVDVWVASSIDRWIKWIFTALSNRTARLAHPMVELVAGNRWPLKIDADWPLPPDETAALRA